MELPIIQNKIYDIRGHKVMLDFDLAELYGVETKVFNQAVKRNINRFPEDFMFRLTPEEWEQGTRSQFVTTAEIVDQGESQNSDNQDERRRSQNVTASGPAAKFRNKGVMPYAFTEHGVTMLASVLRSEKAVNMSIAVVRAFIALKQYAVKHHDIAGQLQEIRDRLGEHDTQLSSIYDAIENLLDDKSEQKTWQERERIGFRK
ncbi:MAG TPA: ORF6N domain-containing protein [Puia sp.]|nr:ORF6N domain-containing protein [Puia sp.]